MVKASRRSGRAGSPAWAGLSRRGKSISFTLNNLIFTFDLSILNMRIVFMGTPDFAVASLDILVQQGYEIVGVVTAPDKPAGRGLQLQESAVKKYAVSKGLKVLQPEKLKNPAF